MINLLKIKELSKSKKMTLEELADKVGMTKQGIYNLMSKNTCNFSTLSKIAEALGVSEAVFFDSNTQQLGGEPMESKVNEVARLSDSERAELEILRERVHSLVIARDALIDQVNLLKEKVENLTNENYGKKSTK